LIRALHIPESPGSLGKEQLLVGDRGNGLKVQPVVYRWTSRAGWVRLAPTSYEVMRMKAVNHKPMNRPKGTPALQGGRGGQKGLPYRIIPRRIGAMHP
jgi:putative transposase